MQLAICSVFFVSNAMSQTAGYIELNGGVMHYASKQNNLVVNPTFGLNLKQQISPKFGLEVLYSGAYINEQVRYTDKFGSVERRETYIANWFGVRALFGKNTDTWALNGFSGLGFRAEKRQALYMEAGVKYGYQLHNAFWLHTAAYFQLDRLEFSGLDPFESYPLETGLFLNFKIGIAYHL